MTFRVGQKVVCVDDSPGAATGNRDLVKGNIYTVTGLDAEAQTDDVYLLGLPLRKHPNRRWKTPAPWRASRFRPLVSRQTDISALQALLVPGAKIREEA